jgi:hypothetical protein
LEARRAAFFEGAGFFEEVGGAGDDLELFGALEQEEGVGVHLDDGSVASADDEECGGGDFFEVFAGEVGSATAGDNGVYA